MRKHSSESRGDKENGCQKILSQKKFLFFIQSHEVEMKNFGLPFYYPLVILEKVFSHFALID